MKQFYRTDLWYASSHSGIVLKNKNADKESSWYYQSKCLPCRTHPQNSSLLLKPLLLEFYHLCLLERSKLRVAGAQPCTGAQPPPAAGWGKPRAGNKNSATILDATPPITLSCLYLEQKACTLTQLLPDSALRQPKVLQFHGANRPAGLKFSLCWSFLSVSAAQTF